jgi:AcrR family transcriptional regulator
MVTIAFQTMYSWGSGWPLRNYMEASSVYASANLMLLQVIPARRPKVSTVQSDRPLRADAQRNRDKLLTVAVAAFAEHGIEASLEDIARRAGVGIGTLYRHFPTRQALLEAVYRDQVEELCASAREHSASAASPAEALADWLRALMVFGATKRNLTSSLMSGPEGKRSEVAVSCSAMVRDAVSELLADAQRSGEIRPDVDAVDLLRLSHALSVAGELPSTHADQPDRLMRVLLDGLRAAGTGPAGAGA